MLVETSIIGTRYSEGLASFTNDTYNTFVKDTYAIQYKKIAISDKLLLLLFALDNWSNKPGATNAFTEQQMLLMMDMIYRLRTANKTAGCALGCSRMQNMTGLTSPIYSSTLSILDTNSVDMSLNGTVLSAVSKVSDQSGNRLIVNSDGLYVDSRSSQEVKFIKGSDFETGTNIYNNTSLAGKDLMVFHRGLGYLIFHADDPENEENEFRLLETGGIEIIIPDFDVHDGNNYFFLTIATYE